MRSPTLSQLPAENNKVKYCITDFLIKAFIELYVKFYVSHVKILYIKVVKCLKKETYHVEIYLKQYNVAPHPTQYYLV